MILAMVPCIRDPEPLRAMDPRVSPLLTAFAFAVRFTPVNVDVASCRCMHARSTCSLPRKQEAPDSHYVGYCKMTNTAMDISDIRKADKKVAKVFGNSLAASDDDTDQP